MGRIKITLNRSEKPFRIGDNHYQDLGKVEILTDEEGPDFVRMTDVMELYKDKDPASICIVVNQEGVQVYELLP
jgi:hypothetical protein